MIRRWIIRSFFMLPILLCMGGWVWSGWHTGQIAYYGHSHWIEEYASGGWVMCGTEAGVILLGRGACVGEVDGCRYTVTPLAHARALPQDGLVGFRYDSVFSTERHSDILSVPYWFFIVLFSAILFVVWRKTNKTKLGRVSPVETAAKEKQA